MGLKSRIQNLGLYKTHLIQEEAAADPVRCRAKL